MGGKYFILGGGSVTTEYYLPALRFLGRLADVTVIDPEVTKIAPMLRGFDGVAFCDQGYVDFLKALPPPGANLNCVVVALPNQLHLNAVNLALARGCHVLCEKPLALRAEDCARLRELAAARQRCLKVGMSWRYMPAFLMMRDIVAKAELGKVRSIEVHDCTPFGWRPRSFAFFSAEAGGVLADIGVHYLDYVETLLGPLRPVAYCDDIMGGSKSTLHYRLTADGDVTIDMRLSRIHSSGAYLRIVCERGEIRFDKASHVDVLVTPRGSMTRRLSAENPFDDPNWPKSFHGSFCQMLADFDAAIAGRPSKIADVADAERTAALVEWAYATRKAAAILDLSLRRRRRETRRL